MNSAKRYLVIALSFAICMTVFAAFAPRIAHAITATLVQVVNTGSNPVPTADGGTYFEANVCHQRGSSTDCAPSGSGPDHFVVPLTTSAGAAVKRLVIEHVSGICSTYNNTLILGPAFYGGFAPDSAPNGSGALAHYISIPPTSGNNYVNSPSNIQESDYLFSQPTHFVFNPGDNVGEIVWFSFNDANNIHQDLYCSSSLEGHLETQ